MVSEKELRERRHEVITMIIRLNDLVQKEERCFTDDESKDWEILIKQYEALSEEIDPASVRRVEARCDALNEFQKRRN